MSESNGNEKVKEEKGPVPKGFVRIKNRVIEDIWQALTALSNRRLEDRKCQKDVVQLLRLHFDAPRRVYQDLRAEVIKEHPAPEGWESETLPVGVLEIRLHEFRDIDEDEQDIPEIPKTLLLSDKHLPKLIKGELGDQNQFGLGDIMKKLHFIFTSWPEDAKVKDGEDGTKETTGE